MADQPASKSKSKDASRKRPQTVRERSQTVTGQTKTRRRVVNKTARTIWKPFQIIGEGLKVIFHPLRFVLRPFKTRPMRFVGRILAKVLLINYFRTAFHELKGVTWPNRKETVKLTFAVFIFAIIFGAVVAITDYGLDKLFHKILLS